MHGTPRTRCQAGGPRSATCRCIQ